MNDEEKNYAKAFDLFLEEYEMLCKRHGGIRLYVRGGQMAISNDVDNANDELIKPVFASYWYQESKFYNLVGNKWELEDE